MGTITTTAKATSTDGTKIPPHPPLHPPCGINKTALGRHLLIELYGCDTDFLNSKKAISKAMTEAAVAAGATVVETVFHHFSPHGISGVVVIAESHLTVHTWPEYGYAALDVFTCADRLMPDRIRDILVDKFGAENVLSKGIDRGFCEPEVTPTPTVQPSPSNG